MKRLPIRRAWQLAALDDAEIIQGYWDGKDGWPEPGDNRSFSYWHGWRNGAVDGGHREKDEAQADLARDVVAQKRARKSPRSVGDSPEGQLP